MFQSHSLDVLDTGVPSCVRCGCMKESKTYHVRHLLRLAFLPSIKVIVYLVVHLYSETLHRYTIINCSFQSGVQYQIIRE